MAIMKPLQSRFCEQLCKFLNCVNSESNAPWSCVIHPLYHMLSYSSLQYFQCFEFGNAAVFVCNFVVRNTESYFCQNTTTAYVTAYVCVLPMPVALCSWYLSMSMCRLVVKNSSVALSLWCTETISFFCLDNKPLCLSRLILRKTELLCVYESKIGIDSNTHILHRKR